MALEIFRFTWQFSEKNRSENWEVPEHWSINSVTILARRIDVFLFPKLSAELVNLQKEIKNFFGGLGRILNC